VEKSRLTELHSKAAHRLSAESAKAREEFIEHQAADLARRCGVPAQTAKEIVIKQCRGLLLPSIALPFDDDDLAGKTVADVLADPAAYEGETLADPLEGVDYGRCKAKIMRHIDGTPWINSFAHGRTTYELKLDAAAVHAAMDTVRPAEVVATFIRLALQAAIDPVEEGRLIAHAKKLSGDGIREIVKVLKEARTARAAEQHKEERKRRMAARTDPRPMLPAPAPSTPWLPQMKAYNDVLSKSRDRVPPARNIDGDLARVQQIEIAGTHAFVSANEDADTSKPASPQWVIRVMSEYEAAEMLERHIDFVDSDGYSVHCPTPFARPT
jgi:hypothetical protein